METKLLALSEFSKSQILHEEKDFLIVYKSPGMHSTPLKGDEENLVSWCVSFYPEIGLIKGRREREGGCLHRLDFETHGLVLFARNQDSFDELAKEQEEGRMLKEYGCLAAKAETKLPGFPVFSANNPNLIGSPFRSFGPGKKSVRPVAEGLHKSRLKDVALDKGNPYKTEILEKFETLNNSKEKETWYFRLKIQRGFRHQIRCHMAWIGYPILNDPLYGNFTPGGILALRAQALRFKDLYFCISPINEAAPDTFA
ncbi:pseudouridine synthase family protein [Leadbettera azotonutricia]|uniref:Ribosomal large subunit pseudouridine synthase D n=1 Tax=Leadbettera azotonutricia (strain ATCC BAA-888 / DSM 13862 / ZAS-9) TaxID=545695 RepID=F5YAC7_LEAAZ|nr:RNA pseudouridine synthase [Leadbettera azotonutricia]AEF80989.1 ribosomal large subunit pseudouridine synthase D [Leadbettera azotonutricia ZAS-9]